jgi:GAF domain-containing protein
MAKASDTERARLAALQSYKVLDTPAEKVFDSIAGLAASITGTPTALISFVDGDRQWFKAKVGLEAAQTPRDISFCTHAIGSDDLFIVPDATRDARFAQNPLVTEAPNIRFYAGAPLITLEGHALGTLCVIDYIPRDFTPEEQQALRDLSQYVMAQLELRKRLTQFTQGNPARQRTIATIRNAIDKNEFLLHYQPTVDLRTGHFSHLEALLRWQSPQRGLFSPLEILPILEESGLIVEVGT